MRVDLGKDRWAEIVEDDDMPHGLVVRCQKLIPPWDQTLSPEENRRRYTPEAMNTIRDTLIAGVVKAWSFEEEPPGGDLEALEFLPSSAYDRLVEHTEGHWVRLGFSKSEPDPKTASTRRRASSSA